MHSSNLNSKRTLVILILVASTLLSACGATQSQPRVYQIGEVNSSARFDTVITGFKAGMVDLGYTEGKNVTYVYDGPASSADKQDAAAQKLVAAKVDLIVALGSPSTVAVQKATAGTNIPVVFLQVIDPVKSGFVQSLANPGGNSTGITVGSEVYGKGLEWLLKASPNVKHIYIPYDSASAANSATVFALSAMKEAAPKLGVELVSQEISSADDVPAAIAAISGDIDAIAFVPGTPIVTARLNDFINVSMQRKLPLLSTVLDWVDSGALIAYSTQDSAVGKQGARLADRILKGVKPADLPVETAEYFLGINLKTAQAINLNIPDDIVRSASVIVR